MITELLIDILLGILIFCGFIIIFVAIFYIRDLVIDEPFWLIPICGTAIGIFIYIFS